MFSKLCEKLIQMQSNMMIRYCTRIFFLALCFFQGITLAAPIFSPERYNLKLLETAPMLFEFHRLTTTSANQEYHYPQRDSAWRANATEHEKDALLKYSSSRVFFATSLVGGIDYRGGESLGDTICPMTESNMQAMPVIVDTCRSTWVLHDSMSGAM